MHSSQRYFAKPRKERKVYSVTCFLTSESPTFLLWVRKDSVSCRCYSCGRRRYVNKVQDFGVHRNQNTLPTKFGLKLLKWNIYFIFMSILVRYSKRTITFQRNSSLKVPELVICSGDLLR